MANKVEKLRRDGKQAIQNLKVTLQDQLKAEEVQRRRLADKEQKVAWFQQQETELTALRNRNYQIKAEQHRNMEISKQNCVSRKQNRAKCMQGEILKRNKEHVLEQRSLNASFDLSVARKYQEREKKTNY